MATLIADWPYILAVATALGTAAGGLEGALPAGSWGQRAASVLASVCIDLAGVGKALLGKRVAK
jgi:hypothetical protein